ncbi:glycosyltransferase family 24 protein [Atractiella rhizophila]|nr:glycosyltransferase family 24 protein [Atractiella rhizophila]
MLFPLLALLPATSAAPPIKAKIELGSEWVEPSFALRFIETLAVTSPSSLFPFLSSLPPSASHQSDKATYSSYLSALASNLSATELSFLKFSLSLQEATPRIQAAWSWYDDALLAEKSERCEGDNWVDIGGAVACSVEELRGLLGESDRGYKSLPFDHELRNPHFSRNEKELPAAILYARPASSTFQSFHSYLSNLATSTDQLKAKVKYIIRWRPEEKKGGKEKHGLSNWGASLHLKKSDYLAIDDRQVEEGDASTQQENEDRGGRKIRTMKTHELYDAGLRTTQYILSAEDPLEALETMSQDFLINFPNLPPMSQVTEEVESEIMYNQQNVYDGGRSALWINGIQMSEKEVDGFSLLRSIRREYEFMSSLTNLSLSPQEALETITHPALTAASSSAATGSGFITPEALGELFDFTDRNEGGDLILWWNDLERDKRYSSWPKNVQIMLRPTYPGQMTQVGRNLMNIVLVLDLSRIENIKLISENVNLFIQKGFPLRVGVVPALHAGDEEDIQTDMARIIWYLVDAVGRGKTMEYLEHLAKLEVEELTEDLVASNFNKFFHKKRQNDGDDVLTFEEVLSPDSIVGAEGELKLLQARKYARRLGVELDGEKNGRGSFFMNGKYFDLDDDWLRHLQETAMTHSQFIMQQVYLKKLTDDVVASLYFPNLPTTFKRRNDVVFPSSTGRPLKIVDLVKASSGLEQLFKRDRFWTYAKYVEGEEARGNTQPNSTLWIVGDFDSPHATSLLREALIYMQEQDGRARLSFIHNPSAEHYHTPKGRSYLLLGYLTKALVHESPVDILATLDLASPGHDTDVVRGDASVHNEDVPEADVEDLRKLHAEFASRLGFQPGESGVLLNGRVINDLKNVEMVATDFEILVEYETKMRVLPAILSLNVTLPTESHDRANLIALSSSVLSLAYAPEADQGMFTTTLGGRQRYFDMLSGNHSVVHLGSDPSLALIELVMLLDPLSESAQRWATILKALKNIPGVYIRIYLNPARGLAELPIRRFYRYHIESEPHFTSEGSETSPWIQFLDMPEDALMTFNLEAHPSWLAFPKKTVHDLDNILLKDLRGSSRTNGVVAIFELENIVVEGHARDVPSGIPPRGLQLELARGNQKVDTIVMANLGYFQLKANPGMWSLAIREGRSSEIFDLESVGIGGLRSDPVDKVGNSLVLMTFEGSTIYPRFRRRKGMEKERLVELPEELKEGETPGQKVFDKAQKFMSSMFGSSKKKIVKKRPGADINVFTVASGHLYERMAFIMIKSVLTHTKSTVKFWFIQNFLSPSFKAFIPHMAKEYGFEYELVTFKWPHWLRAQTEKQRTIWGYKILFLDVLFPLDVDRVIFVDSDQIVRADLKELAELDLEGAPYAYAPMGDSRPEIEGFRFWKGGYWAETLQGKPYHISALYVIDLDRFRQLAAGDKLRGQYQALSADPNSLANLDQDLPNVMQSHLPIHTLDQDWLWCETWCSDASLKTAKTIDLCNNPMTHEPKLARAKRLIPEWTVYDDEIAALAKRVKAEAKDADDSVGAIAEVAADSLGQAKQQEEERQEFVGESKKEEVELIEEKQERPKDEL